MSRRALYLLPIRPRLFQSSVAPGMTAPIAVFTAVAGIGAYAWYSRKSSADHNNSGNMDASATKQASKPIFSSFGFHSLKVESTELVNHNTKRIRFALPDKSVPSGLGLSSAVLAFSFPGGGWIPCLRPYTPTNNLGMFSRSCPHACTDALDHVTYFLTPCGRRAGHP
jgi:cytochrome-b5 reductase